jgi:glycosyltransferase involved in cell wall biosynthesis
MAYHARVRPSVLHVSRSVGGGVGRVVADLVTDQVTRGWRVAVASPVGQLSDEATAAGAQHVEWAARREVRSFVTEVPSLARAISSFGPDVVHLHSAKAGLAGRLAVRGSIPTVYQPHGWPFLLGDRTDPAARAWERWAAHWTDVVVCVSGSEATRGRAIGVRGTIEVIHNGVDLTRFPTSDDGQRNEARAALGLADVPLVVCVGRVCRQKAQDVLLDVWPDVRARVPGATLALVGDGPMRAELEQRNVSGVLWAGHRDDVVAWLLAADVVTQPSRAEGLAMTVLEAMACRRSLVVSDADGMVEAVGRGADGAGCIVGVEQHSDLADALVARLTHPTIAAAEGDNGRIRVERGFDRERVNQSVARLVESLIDPERQPARARS